TEPALARRAAIRSRRTARAGPIGRPWGAGAGPAERTRSCPRRPAFARLRFLHRQRTTPERLVVQPIDGLIRMRVVGVLDESEATHASGFTVGGQVAVSDRTDRPEVFSKLGLGGLVRQI